MSQDKPSKRSRLRNDTERARRQARVMELRFVRRCSIGEIAAKLGVSERTVQRDIKALRKRSRKALDRIDEHVKDLVADFSLLFNEKVRHLWSEYARLQKDPGSTHMRLIVLSKIGEAENNLADQLRKLGFVYNKEEAGSVPAVNVFNFAGGSSYGDFTTDQLEGELKKRFDLIGFTNGRSANRL